MEEDSPETAFHEFRLAFETDDWSKALKRFSPGMQKLYVFESFFAGGEADDVTRAKFDEIARKHGYDEAEIEKKLKHQSAKTGKAITPDDFTNEIIASIDNVNSFLEESWSLFNPKRPRYRKTIKNLTVDGNRASLTTTSVSYSWRTDESGKTTRNENETSERIYFRKYDGRWKICLKDEWEDPDFKFEIK